MGAYQHQVSIYHKGAMALFLSGLALVLWATWELAKLYPLGSLGIVLYGGVCLACAGVLLFIRQKGGEQLKLEVQQQELQQQRILQQQALAAEAERQAQQQALLDEGLKQLAQKEQRVREQLIAYQQFKEYDGIERWGEQFNTDRSQQQLQVAQLLDEQMKQFYAKIADNRYQSGEQFLWDQLGGDLVNLIESVARIYHPESQHPLLETKIENLLRALNRFSVQTLLFLEQLPLDIKSYNLRKTYDYVQSGVKYYKIYKKAEPYLSYTKYLSPLIRVSTGTNPVTAVIYSILMEAGKQGTKKLSELYALNLLRDLVEIIGDQAETIFDDGYRYQSKDWVTGVELIEIAHRLYPLPAEALSKVAKMVTSLLIKSEYDRIYLYRMLLNGQSLIKEDIQYGFTPEICAEIGGNCALFIDQLELKEDQTRSIDQVMKWREAAQKRLNNTPIPLKLDKMVTRVMESQLMSGSPVRKMRPDLTHYLKALELERIDFIYPDAFGVEESGKPIKVAGWLIGTANRLLWVVETGSHTFKLLWQSVQGESPAAMTRRVNKVADDSEITGGLWLGEERYSAILVEGVKIGTYEGYFRLLLDFFRE